MEKKYKKFADVKNVAIPIIQRDYVQGADKNAEKRNRFVDRLFEALLDGKQYKIDFIFGSSDSGYFIPIDGQQRLTTLALLGWLLNQKSAKDYSGCLSRLDYTSRPSTEQFCKELYEFNLPKDYNSISEHIKTVPGWFSYSWLDDPSINAMLDLLDYADRRLSEGQYAENVEDMANRFFDNSPICFDLLDMNALNLNDDLYIKMNARGKLLTTFENWKAEFEGHLDKEFHDVEYEFRLIPGQKGNPKINEYFEYAIEHDWCDMLWPISYDRWDAYSDDQKKTVDYPRIDEEFMNLVDFISRFLFYAARTEDELEAEAKKLKEQSKEGLNVNWFRWIFDHDVDKQRLSVYETEENTVLLMRMIDTLVDIRKEHGDFKTFLNLISTSNESSKKPDDTDAVKVNLYDSPTVDLITLCLEGNLDYFREITLWGLLKWLLRHPGCVKKGADLTDLTDYIRIIVGWARGRNQRLTKGLNVGMNLRVTHYRDADKIIDALADAPNISAGLANITEKSMDEEKEKFALYGTPKFDIVRKLSPCRSLFYCFNLLLPTIETIADTEVDGFIDKFYGFMALSDQDRIQSLVRHGFKGVKTDLSNFRFYGLESKWDYIFTMASDHGSFTNTREALEDAILGKPDRQDLDELQYYITQYPEFIEARNSRGFPDSKPTHYMKRNHWWEIWSVKTFSSNPLQGYNVDPFGFVVQERYEGKRLYLWAESEYSEHGVLWIRASDDENYITMECVRDGWKIDCRDKCGKVYDAFSAAFIETDADGNIRYRDPEEKFTFNGDILTDADGIDRIQSALNFVTRLHNAITS